MNKKLCIGAMVLSATALFGLAGCGDKNGNNPPEVPPIPTYTVTFDHDNDPTTPATYVEELEQGVTELSSVPNVPEMDGFAGVWNSYTLNNEDITVTASYGDGTQANPYMVATHTQFKRILNTYTAYIGTTYRRNGMVCDEAEALTMAINYKTVSIIYSRSSVDSEWVYNGYEITNKVYFKLVNDINLSNIQGLADLDLSGRYFAGEIDGQNHNIFGLDGALFKSTTGSMFANVINSTFKNINIHLGSNLGSIATTARGGNVRFDNVNIYNNNSTPTTIWADDNNESAFIAFATGNTNLLFMNCTNNADFIIYAKNSGMFVGGYATNTTSVTFYNCVNNGNIISRGNVGLFFGNDAHKPQNYYIQRCEHNGSVTALGKSHILVPQVAGTSAFGDLVSDYDMNIDNVISGLNMNSLSLLSTNYSATITDNNIEVSNAEVKAGKYQLVLSAYAISSRGNTLLTNIVINKSKSYTNTNPILFENVYYGMMDLNTYNASALTNKLDSSALADSDWVSISGYNIKYFVDQTNGLYVIDYSNFDNELSINVNASNLEKTVVYTGDGIEFIVDFTTNN